MYMCSKESQVYVYIYCERVQRPNTLHHENHRIGHAAKRLDYDKAEYDNYFEG